LGDADKTSQILDFCFTPESTSMSALCQNGHRPLPQRDDQPVEVGGDLAARQSQHRAILVGQHDHTSAWAYRGARACRTIDAINVGRPSDVADCANGSLKIEPTIAIYGA
jgi:hypothetical protein